MKTGTIFAVAIIGLGAVVSAEWPNDSTCGVIPLSDPTMDSASWENILSSELPLADEEHDSFVTMDIFANQLMATEALTESEIPYDVNELCEDGKPCPCLKCIEGSGKKILCYIFEKIKKVCEKTKCPRIKKYCKLFETHKDFATGFIIEKVRPFLLGASYCCGHGECRHPHVSNITEVLTSSDAVPDGILQQISDLIANSDNQVVKSASSSAKAAAPIVAGEVGRDKKCVDCLQHSIAFILHHLWEEIKKYCDKAKQPRAKKYCEWIYKHKGVTTGYLYGAVEPWKYSLGFCVGNKSCKNYHPNATEEVEQQTDVLAFYEGKTALRINAASDVY